LGGVFYNPSTTGQTACVVVLHCSPFFETTGESTPPPLYFCHVCRIQRLIRGVLAQLGWPPNQGFKAMASKRWLQSDGLNAEVRKQMLDSQDALPGHLIVGAMLDALGRMHCDSHANDHQFTPRTPPRRARPRTGLRLSRQLPPPDCRSKYPLGVVAQETRTCTSQVRVGYPHVRHPSLRAVDLIQRGSSQESAFNSGPTCLEQKRVCASSNT